MNLDRLKYRYWQHTDWHNENSPLEAVYCNIVDGCDPTIAVSDFEFCTGLKDKNGNLIYEGDILLLHNNKFEVGHNNITVFFKCLTDKYTHIDPMDFDYNESEIIGNIHEQAEQKEVK